MNKKVSTAVLVLIFGAIGVDSAAHANPPVEHCGVGDVTSIAQAAPQGFSQLAAGSPTPGIPDALMRCQARLYDDNGPDPHVWCEQDLFLLGVLIFENYKLLGLDRETVAGFLEQLIHQVFWTSPAGTTEVEVSRTATRDVVFPGLGHLLVFHDYTVMGQPTLLPGNYTWDWVQKHPFYADPDNPDGIIFTAAGTVKIVSHQEHLSLIAAGTW